MPTYNYECIECNSVIRLFQSMNDKVLELYDCKKCNKKQKVRRLISGGSGMIFKGSGFYLTDYTQYGDKVESQKKEKSEKIKKEATTNGKD